MRVGFSINQSAVINDRFEMASCQPIPHAKQLPSASRGSSVKNPFPFPTEIVGLIVELVPFTELKGFALSCRWADDFYLRHYPFSKRTYKDPWPHVSHGPKDPRELCGDRLLVYKLLKANAVDRLLQHLRSSNPNVLVDYLQSHQLWRPNSTDPTKPMMLDEELQNALLDWTLDFESAALPMACWLLREGNPFVDFHEITSACFKAVLFEVQ